MKLRSFIFTPLLIFLAASICTARAGDWPQWLGPERSGHVPAGERAPSTIPGEPRVLWRLKVGEGHSGPILSGRHLIFCDAEEESETVHVLEAATGRELWKRTYSPVYGDEWGAGPRSTPYVDGDRVYVQSCRGDFACFQLADGKLLWQTSFEKDFGVTFLGSKVREGTARRRGNSGAGVIDGNAVILPVGGSDGASLVAFDKLNGKVLWKSGQDEAAYAPLNLATIGGTRQVVAFLADALCGTDARTGRPLWRVPLKTNAKRHAAMPLILGDHVFANSHTFGLASFKISRAGDEWKATEAWINTDAKINLATPVIAGGHLYSQGPNKDYVCIEARTGKIKWRQDGFGKEHSSTIVMNDRLLVLTDTGLLVMVARDPEKYVELGRAQVCGKTWSIPAWAGGKLYVRDNRELICLDLFQGS